MENGWLTLIVVIIVTSVAGWIGALRVRRRMGRALGRQVTDAEITSIYTWMKVHEGERRDQGNKP